MGDKTMYISLAGAREKLIRDTIRLEEEIIEANSSIVQRRLLNYLGTAYIKIGEISQQMYELDNKPDRKRSLWDRLSGR